MTQQSSAACSCPVRKKLSTAPKEAGWRSKKNSRRASSKSSHSESTSSRVRQRARRPAHLYNVRALVPITTCERTRGTREERRGDEKRRERTETRVGQLRESREKRLVPRAAHVECHALVRPDVDRGSDRRRRLRRQAEPARSCGRTRSSGAGTGTSDGPLASRRAE